MTPLDHDEADIFRPSFQLLFYIINNPTLFKNLTATLIIYHNFQTILKGNLPIHSSMVINNDPYSYT